MLGKESIKKENDLDKTFHSIVNASDKITNNTFRNNVK